MKIILLSHTYYGSPYKVGSHFLFDEFKRLNHEVLHVSTPITPFHRILKFFTPMRTQLHRLRFNKRQHILGSLVPNVFVPIQSNFCRIFPSRNLIIELSGKIDLIIIDQVLFLNYAKFFSPGAQVVLRLTDLISKKRELNLIYRERHRIGKVIVTNKAILENLQILESKAIVVPNGYPSSLSNFSPSDTERQGMIYVGSLDSRIDWNLVWKISEDPKFEFLHIFGHPKPDRDLPDRVSYLGLATVEETSNLYGYYKYGLLPYEKSPNNICRSPMKLHEYINCGLAVLAPSFFKNANCAENESVTTFESWFQAQFEGTLPVRNLQDTFQNGLTWETISQRILDYCHQSKKEALEVKN
jgi:hypothetical protein